MISAGVQGAFLLARGRADGVLLMEESPQGAARSFWAAAICLPAFLALRFFAWAFPMDPPPAVLGEEVGLLRPLVAELLGYAVAWMGFALASLPLAQSWGCGSRWPRFLCAWNWSNVVQYLVLLGVAAVSMLGLSMAAGQALGLVALGYALWLEWFAARSALQVSGARAAALVAVDLGIGLFLGGLVQRLSAAGG